MAGHSSWEEQRYLYPHDYRDKFPIWERDFNIEPFKFERSRLPFRMTNEERLWRKQYLQDQVLAADEPKNVPNLDKLHKNPIRYRWMVFWDGIFNKIRPVVVRIDLHFRLLRIMKRLSNVISKITSMSNLL